MCGKRTAGILHDVAVRMEPEVPLWDWRTGGTRRRARPSEHRRKLKNGSNVFSPGLVRGNCAAVGLKLATDGRQQELVPGASVSSKGENGESGRCL